MHEAIVAGLTAYSVASTFLMSAAITQLILTERVLRKARWKIETLDSLLKRRRRREQGLPQPRDAKGQFTAA